MPPRFEMLKPPPCISSSAILRARAFSAAPGVLLSHLVERRDVRDVELRDVWHRLPGGAQMLGSLAADGAHRLPLDLAPPGKIRQRLRRRSAAAALDEALRMRLDVL